MVGKNALHISLIANNPKPSNIHTFVEENGSKNINRLNNKAMLLKRNRVKLDANTWLVDVEIKLDIPTNESPTKWSCLFSNLHSLVLAKLKSSNNTK
ncbi:protein of unknown function [Vibrio tapetis subsp. tapetis]|uniref:Uncharacterized protein n=1 Tax=Vibrio tapetis subsp. tapetis TaxID=1671868 RepID=A0A2N8ZHF6_9VIBR|nr:protein of unknown function [Vibrio tapetis subsp. tapetis]